MKLTIRSTLHSLVAPILCVTLISMGMDKPEHPTKQKIDAIIQRPLLKNNFKPSLTGRIEFAFDHYRRKSHIGYGCKDCFATLKKIGIFAPPNCPLVKVSIFIDNCEDSSLETDVTKEYGLAWVIADNAKYKAYGETDKKVNEINTLLEEESSSFCDAYVQDIQTDYNKLTTHIKKLENNFFEATQTTLPDLPSFLPVESLIPGKIVIDNERFSMNLTFNQHAVLEILLEDFKKNPVLFTYNNSDIYAIKKLPEDTCRDTTLLLVKDRVIKKRKQQISESTRIIHKDTTIHTEKDAKGKNLFKLRPDSKTHIKKLTKQTHQQACRTIKN